MKKRQIFIVNYSINYSSGKIWKEEREVIALTKQGAFDLIKWIKAPQDISVNSIFPTYRYIGDEICEDRKVLGNY